MPETEMTDMAPGEGPEPRGFQLDVDRAFNTLKAESGSRIAELMGDLAVKNTIITQLAEENQKIADRAKVLSDQNQNLRDAVEGLEARLAETSRSERPRPQVVRMATDPASEVVEVDVADGA